MSLSDMQCRAAKPKTKPFKLYDLEGLYLEVKPSGGKYWRQKYRYFGKEKCIALGPYPRVSLLEARKKKEEVLNELQKGFDPLLLRLEKEQATRIANAMVFKKVALEWLEKQAGCWTDRYMQSVKFRLEKYAFPYLGDIPIYLIKPPMMLACLQKIEETSPETTRRVKALCNHIFNYGIGTGRNESNPTIGLHSLLKKFRSGHYKSITVDEFPDFIVRLHEYRDRISRQTFLSTMALLLTMVRTGELIGAKRSEFDLKNKMWIIPPERMKMKLPHMVPLSNQMVKIVQELISSNVNSEYLFPSYSNPRKPMCKNTILTAIKRMGYNGRMTGHGFRSLGMGLNKEKLGYSHEVVDRQLAHVPKNSVDRAYDRAQFLPQRTEMMQSFADYVDKVYLDELKKKMSKS